MPMVLPVNYTWAVPQALVSKIKPGRRLALSRKPIEYARIVRRLHIEKPTVFEPRDILNVLDAEPIIFAEQQHLWEWMARYYLCSEGEVMQAAWPTHLKLSSETVLLFNEEAGEDFSNLDDEEFVV